MIVFSSLFVIFGCGFDYVIVMLMLFVICFRLSVDELWLYG